MNKLFIALVCFSVFTLSFAEACTSDSDEVSCVADCGTVPTPTVADGGDYITYAACVLGCGTDASGNIVTDCDTLATCYIDCTQTLADAVSDAAAGTYYQCVVDCANSSILAFSMIVLIFIALLF